MHGGKDHQKFGISERNLIRMNLIGYMAEHGIGADRMVERITNAHPHRMTIPRKTFQRFLGGDMRTNDAAVALCHHFAEGIKASDSIPYLGKTLSAFYSSELSDEYVGTYYAGNVSPGSDYFSTEVISGTKIDIVQDDGFCRVTEKTASFPFNAVYDGVLVCVGRDALVVLKDRFQGLARTYMLGWRGRENWSLHIHGGATNVDNSDYFLIDVNLSKIQ
jgi:hypothetical protein